MHWERDTALEGLNLGYPEGWLIFISIVDMDVL